MSLELRSSGAQEDSGDDGLACPEAALLLETVVGGTARCALLAKALSYRARGCCGKSRTSGLRGGRRLRSGTMLAPTGSCVRTSQTGHTLRGCERCV
jgi:hypothetical protein